MTDSKDTLFGHLALSFSSHPENLATEALGFVLRRSDVAREALCHALEQAGVKVPGVLHFENQVSGDDSARPDLVGIDKAGQQLLIIEAKFWAGLTENQPVTYLARLPKDADGALVVVAPEKRIPLLWHELLDRCKDAKLQVVESPNAGSFPVASVGRVPNPFEQVFSASENPPTVGRRGSDVPLQDWRGDSGRRRRACKGLSRPRVEGLDRLQVLVPARTGVRPR